MNDNLPFGDVGTLTTDAAVSTATINVEICAIAGALAHNATKSASFRMLMQFAPTGTQLVLFAADVLHPFNCGLSSKALMVARNHCSKRAIYRPIFSVFVLGWHQFSGRDSNHPRAQTVASFHVLGCSLRTCAATPCSVTQY